MSMLLWIPPLSAALAALASLVPGWRAAARLSGVLVSALLLACGITLVMASRGGGVPVAAGGLLRADWPSSGRSA